MAQMFMQSATIWNMALYFDSFNHFVLEQVEVSLLLIIIDDLVEAEMQ